VSNFLNAESGENNLTAMLLIPKFHTKYYDGTGFCKIKRIHVNLHGFSFHRKVRQMAYCYRYASRMIDHLALRPGKEGISTG
jgi:hypothetical protein